MKNCFMRRDAFDELFRLISQALGKPMSFHDLDGNVPSEASRKIRYARYCLARRHDPAFASRCEECDAQGLRQAIAGNCVHAYVCHAGLIDCNIPIFDRAGRFLGGFIIGQMRPRGSQPPEDCSSSERRMWYELGESTLEEMADIGQLVQFLGGYIRDNEILCYRAEPWVADVEKFLNSEGNSNASIADVARAVGRSKSFLSHKFRIEFGISFKQYQTRLRMQQAKELLVSGLSVKTASAKLRFSDPYIFSKAFKRFWGRSPVAFRKNKAENTTPDMTA